MERAEAVMERLRTNIAAVERFDSARLWMGAGSPVGSSAAGLSAAFSSDSRAVGLSCQCSQGAVMRIMTVGRTGAVAMQRVLKWMAASNEQVWVSDYANQHPEPAGTFDFYPLLPDRRMGGALGVPGWVTWLTGSRPPGCMRWPAKCSPM